MCIRDSQKTIWRTRRARTKVRQSADLRQWQYPRALRAQRREKATMLERQESRSREKLYRLADNVWTAVCAIVFLYGFNNVCIDGVIQQWIKPRDGVKIQPFVQLHFYSIVVFMYNCMVLYNAPWIKGLEPSLVEPKDSCQEENNTETCTNKRQTNSCWILQQREREIVNVYGIENILHRGKAVRCGKESSSKHKSYLVAI